MSPAEGRVQAIWRYPVKSMLGEARESADLDVRGLEGDRLYAVRDAEGQLGSGKDTRRMRRMAGLFACAARQAAGADHPTVTCPCGLTLEVGDPRLDAELTRLLGIAVSVQREGKISHFDDSPVHLVTTASLDWLAATIPTSRLDERRFRPNLVVDVAGSGRVEEGWIGKTVAIGEVRLRVHDLTERCVMTTMAQADLADDPDVLRALARESEACFGVYADVIAPGRIARGDGVRILS